MDRILLVLAGRRQISVQTDAEFDSNRRDALVGSVDLEIVSDQLVVK